MTVKVAINGFGRIGRLALRSIVELRREDVEVVACCFSPRTEPFKRIIFTEN